MANLLLPSGIPVLDLCENLGDAGHAPVQGVERFPIDRKKNGIFYTPTRATRILSHWAIKNSDEYVLEPSFGGCGFLAAVRERLVSLGSVGPEQRLCGCDVDPNAFGHLSDLLKGKFPDHRFRDADFLTLTPGDFSVEGFTVVIGNPPYVSLHNMEDTQRETARMVAAAAGVSLSAKASLWAYFVLHSLAFLKRGGRMAWILPGSFVHAEYSVAVRDKLHAVFGRSLAIQLDERLFLTEGTEENSVVLLCEDYGEQSDSSFELSRATDLDELQDIVDRWSSHEVAGVNWSGRASVALLSPDVRSVWTRVLERGNAKPLSDVAIFRIGIVTGANSFFIISQQRAEELGLPEASLCPIVAKFAHCKGLQLSDSDLVANVTAGFRCILVDTAGFPDISGALQAYLESFPENKRAANRTFAKRKIWHQPNDDVVPDAFFSCMQGDGPTMVLNNTGVTCTNTVHRLTFRAQVPDIARYFLAVAVQSTFTQFSAELEGRSYGSGGLKIEPSEAGRMQALVPDAFKTSCVESAFSRVDRLLRTGARNEARNVADEMLVRHDLISPDELATLRSTLSQLRQSRRGSRREKNDEQF